jgi:hypothetical protein
MYLQKHIDEVTKMSFLLADLISKEHPPEEQLGR